MTCRFLLLMMQACTPANGNTVKRILLIALGLLVAACNSIPWSDLPDKLVNQTRTFESVARWGDLSSLYGFYKAGPDEQIQIQPGLENIRVTGYEAGPLTQIGELRWAQTAVIDFVLVDRQIVRQITDQQIWVSDDKGKTWLRETPIPVFR